LSVSLPVATPASAPNNSIVTIRADISDPDGVAGAELVWWRTGTAPAVWSCPRQTDERDPRVRPEQIDDEVGSICLRAEDTFTWTVPITATGTVFYRIRAFDVFGRYRLGPTRQFQISP
jgi:hypothetical protein